MSRTLKDIRRLKVIYGKWKGPKTLTALAQSLGIPVSTLSEIENRKTKPTDDQIRKLAKGYGITIEEVLGACEVIAPQLNT